MSKDSSDKNTEECKNDSQKEPNQSANDQESLLSDCEQDDCVNIDKDISELSPDSSNQSPTPQS